MDSSRQQAAAFRNAELDARGALGRQVSRLESRIIAVAALLGLTLGVVLYWVLRAGFGLILGWHSPVITGALAYPPPVFLAIKLSRAVTKTIVRARWASWKEAAASRYRIPASLLADLDVPVL